jgi:hypothetical protein
MAIQNHTEFIMQKVGLNIKHRDIDQKNFSIG